MLINNKSLIKTINQLNLTDDERKKIDKISEDDISRGNINMYSIKRKSPNVALFYFPFLY